MSSLKMVMSTEREINSCGRRESWEVVMSEHVPREALTEIDRVMPILDQISLFGGFSDPQLYTIFRLLKKVSYRKDEIIFCQGDQPSYIYIVLSGSVRIVFDIQAAPLSLAQLQPGACFGETSLIGIQSHSATSVAAEDTELLVLAREDLMWLAEHDAKLFGLLALNIAREACRRLYKTETNFHHYLHLRDAMASDQQVSEGTDKKRAEHSAEDVLLNNKERTLATEK